MIKLIFLLLLSIFPVTATAKTILVMGDSISAAYGIEVQQGWVALLQKKLAAVRPDYQIHNESISGETTAGGLARIGQALQKYHPDIVLLELGANDGLKGLPVTAMKANLIRMLQLAETAGAKVLLLPMKIPPNYGKRYVELFYDVYPQLAKELNIAVTPFILEDIVLQPSMLQADGLHPTAQAQPAIAETVWRHLSALLN